MIFAIKTIFLNKKINILKYKVAPEFISLVFLYNLLICLNNENKQDIFKSGLQLQAKVRTILQIF